MDMCAPLISAAIGHLISLLATGPGGEGGNRLPRTGGRGRDPRRRPCPQVRVTWRGGGADGASW
ncbi:hypothetical protein Ate01nite_38040 [Actinoplanes teichomyceticus]|nr:hypothetical protein Ate01nite_38040 [Actinoplanes teichomyceticus]